tara:strand:+ start:8778 stop:9260 length:483 start_codon:yes stop_codon:yes gene_type:complete
MANEKKKVPNKQTNYYLQDRYASGELNTEEISFEPDKSSRLYTDNSQESVIKQGDLEELDRLIVSNSKIHKIIEDIPTERTINLSIENVNKIYAFCMIILKTNDRLIKLTKVEMFALITDYINLNEKEEKYFYKNLSIKFKGELLDELKKANLYKSNKLF